MFLSFYRLDDGSGNQQMQFYWRKKPQKMENAYSTYFIQQLLFLSAENEHYLEMEKDTKFESCIYN